MTSNSDYSRVTISSEQAQQMQQQMQQLQIQPKTFSPSASSVGNASRIVIGGGEDMTDRGIEFARHTNEGVQTTGGGTSSSAPNAPADIMQSIRSPGGARVSGRDVDPNKCTIEVGGFRTPIRAALASGLIVQNADGSYREAGAPAVTQQGSQQAPEEEQQQQHQEQGQGAGEKLADLEPAAHQYAEQFVQGVDNVTLTSAINSIAESGSMSEHDIAQVASQMGLEASEVQQRVDQIRTGYEGQAREMIGDGADQIIAWARANDPKLMNEAIKAHVQQEDPTAYDNVVLNFWSNIARSNPEAVLNATNAQELGVRRERNGTVTLEVPGAGRMSLEAAARGGFLQGPAGRAVARRSGGRGRR